MFNVLFHKSTAHFLRGAFKEKKWKIRDIVPEGGRGGGEAMGFFVPNLIFFAQNLFNYIFSDANSHIFFKVLKYHNVYFESHIFCIRLINYTFL